MHPDNLICDTSNVTYNKGYVALWLPTYDVPATIDIAGEILEVKDHFHVSLLCVKNLLQVQPDIEERVLELFCEFLQQHELIFEGFTGEFRIAEREERMSLIAMCTVSNLSKLPGYLSEHLAMSVPDQPAHVTLYTKGKNLGIGLNSPEELAEKSRVVDTPNGLNNII